VTLDELVGESEHSSAAETLTKGQTLKVRRRPTREGQTRPRGRRSDEDDPHLLTPGYWEAEGDVAAHYNHWMPALDAYEKAADLMTRQDYTYVRFRLERIGDMLISLNDFDGLEEEIAKADAYLQQSSDRHGQDAQRIHMIAAERRGWEYTWRGRTQNAVEAMTQAHAIAKGLGDEPRVQGTALHFMGRASSEIITTRMLYPRLFRNVVFSASERDQLQYAGEWIRQAREFEEARDNSMAAGYNAQWEARVLRALGRTDEANKLDQRWLQIFTGHDIGSRDRSEFASEPRLDQAKLVLIEEDDPRLAVEDSWSLLLESEESFMDWGYAAGLAEIEVTRAYIDLLKGHYVVSKRGSRTGG
jgi:tetratricopeptide (TPR) repeat protein